MSPSPRRIYIPSPVSQKTNYSTPTSALQRNSFYKCAFKQSGAPGFKVRPKTTLDVKSGELDNSRCNVRASRSSCSFTSRSGRMGCCAQRSRQSCASTPASPSAMPYPYSNGSKEFTLVDTLAGLTRLCLPLPSPSPSQLISVLLDVFVVSAR